MSDIKIIGSSLSTCTRRVTYTAALLNIPLTIQPIDFTKGEHKAPAHLAKQPFGKVPVLEQGSFILYESRAICRYLNDISSSHALIPTDPQAHALFEQWASLELGTYNALIETILYNTIWYKFHGGTPDTAAIQATYDKLNQSLPILDRQLGSHPYIAGESISLVDIWLVPNLWALQQGSPDDAKKIIDAYPNIAAWWKRVTGTPEWQKISSTQA